MSHNSIPFSKEEDAILLKLYGKAPIRKVIMGLVWGRSESQINKRAEELGLKNEMEYCNHWTEKDLIYLIDHYGKEEWGSLVSRLGRPGKSIKEKAKRLGLERDESVSI